MMQNWFPDAKLGVFIHWGIYAINGMGGESWPIANADISHEDYMLQMKKFTASNYDPDDWCDLFERAGAKYAVLTSKHHDGVALWPTRQEGPSIPKDAGTPDLVGEFVKAMRKKALKVGFYFSHTDWTNADHFSMVTGLSLEELQARHKEKTNYIELWQKQAQRDPSGDAEEQKRWKRFLEFHRAQLEEILTDYGEIDLCWFDVMLHPKGYAFPCEELRNLIHSMSDKTIINSRLGEYGDYETPEQFIPVIPPQGPWELCITTNDSWSYTGRENDYKTPFEIITMFCECLGMGGNMLLNVGPDESGVIPAEQVGLLEELGSWIRQHEEAVYGTIAGLPHGYAYGYTSMRKDRKVIYLYNSHLPKGGVTSIKGIRNDIKNIEVLGKGDTCSHKRVGGAPWLNVPGTLWIDIPPKELDPYVTVLKIELDGVLDLYSGEGVEIDVN